jgi:dolichol kinase
VEGTLAFFFSTAILSYFFIGPLAIVLALLTALVESLPAKFDDNFTIPLVSILLYMLVASTYPFLLL